MTTAYKHRVTIAAPEPLMAEANHLACIMGESMADIETFKAANYQDAQGNLYAVCSTVVTDTFMAAQTQGLPDALPPHAEGIADRELAQMAYDSLNSGGLMMVVNDNPQDAIEQMGLTVIQTDEITKTN